MGRLRVSNRSSKQNSENNPMHSRALVDLKEIFAPRRDGTRARGQVDPSGKTLAGYDRGGSRREASVATVRTSNGLTYDV
jgi:hypothetical protein